MERARQEVKDLFPIIYSGEDVSEIGIQNEKWDHIVDTLIAQLRAGIVKNADIASSVHDFYMYSMAVMECSRYTFPSTHLVTKISKLFPLLPREFRQKVNIRDLTYTEKERIMKRIERRLGMMSSPPITKKSSKRKKV